MIISKRGGRRKGAGRKKGNKNRIQKPVYFPPSMLEKIESSMGLTGDTFSSTVCVLVDIGLVEMQKQQKI